MRRIRGDFVEVADELVAADAVILHRVVCCYPDWKRLLDAAAAKADRYLAVTFPRPFTKPLLVFENLFHWVRRRQFRAFVHSPDAMIGLLASAGLDQVARHRTWFWQTVLLARTT